MLSGRLYDLLGMAARAAPFTVLTPYNVAPQYRNQPHPTLPANNPIFSNTCFFFLLMMGIKMPEACRDSSQH